MHDSELLDTFYNGLTEMAKSYIDSVAGNIFRHRTIQEAKELLDLMDQNYDNWHTEEENNIEVNIKKRGILKLSNEDMKEASKAIKEKVLKLLILLNYLKEVLNFLLMNHVSLFKYMLFLLLR